MGTDPDVRCVLCGREGHLSDACPAQMDLPVGQRVLRAIEAGCLYRDAITRATGLDGKVVYYTCNWLVQSKRIEPDGWVTEGVASGWPQRRYRALHAPERPPSAAAQVLAAIKAGHETWYALADATQLPRNVVRNALDHLRCEGKIEAYGRVKYGGGRGPSQCAYREVGTAPPVERADLSHLGMFAALVR